MFKQRYFLGKKNIPEESQDNAIVWRHTKILKFGALSCD